MNHSAWRRRWWRRITMSVLITICKIHEVVSAETRLAEK